jgi:hypothetical protein
VRTQRSVPGLPKRDDVSGVEAGLGPASAALPGPELTGRESPHQTESIEGAGPVPSMGERKGNEVGVGVGPDDRSDVPIDLQLICN